MSAEYPSTFRNNAPFFSCCHTCLNLGQLPVVANPLLQPHDIIFLPVCGCIHSPRPHTRTHSCTDAMNHASFGTVTLWPNRPISPSQSKYGVSEPAVGAAAMTKGLNLGQVLLLFC